MCKYALYAVLVRAFAIVYTYIFLYPFSLPFCSHFICTFSFRNTRKTQTCRLRCMCWRANYVASEGALFGERFRKYLAVVIVLFGNMATTKSLNSTLKIVLSWNCCRLLGLCFFFLITTITSLFCGVLQTFTPVLSWFSLLTRDEGQRHRTIWHSSAGYVRCGNYCKTHQQTTSQYQTETAIFPWKQIIN